LAAKIAAELAGELIEDFEELPRTIQDFRTVAEDSSVSDLFVDANKMV
jgi:hypothetical protein